MSAAARPSQQSPMPTRRGAGAVPYVRALRAHAAARPANFNVPTHKAGLLAPPELTAAIGGAPLELDIPPQVHGVDTGVSPTPLEEAERLAAEAWGAQRTWFMLNGASQANHTVCLALAQRGRRVIVQRNVHASTIDGLVLAGLVPVFVRPSVDIDRGLAHCVSAGELDRVLAEAGDVAGVIVVSPTYFGVAADVEDLVRAAHRRGVPIVVDEAWGAHFAFSPLLPLDALSAGADLVVSSTHKMLGSLTQSAMLHLGWSEAITSELVGRAASLTQTTSPSAILAASLDAARERAAAQGAELLAETIPAAIALRQRLRGLPGVDILDERHVARYGAEALDLLRIAIDLRATGRNGYDVQSALRDAGVLVELTSDTMLVAVLGMGETEAHADGLVQGLRIALERTPPRTAPRVDRDPPWGPLRKQPREAFLGPTQRVPIEQAIGRVAAEALAVYPPGSPNVLPGEQVTVAVARHLMRAAEAGAVIRGSIERPLRTIRVVADEEDDGRAEEHDRIEGI